MEISEQLVVGLTLNGVSNKADIKFCIYWVKLISSSSRKLILGYFQTFEALKQRGKNKQNSRLRKLAHTEQHFPWKNAGVFNYATCIVFDRNMITVFPACLIFLLARARRVGTL